MHIRTAHGWAARQSTGPDNRPLWKPVPTQTGLTVPVDGDPLYTIGGERGHYFGDKRVVGGMAILATLRLGGEDLIDIGYNHATKAVEIAQPGQTPILLDEGYVVSVGRGAYSVTHDWPLGDHVSRNHASLGLRELPNGDRFVFVQDLGSLNGTDIASCSLPDIACNHENLGVSASVAEKWLKGEDRHLVLSKRGVFGVFDGVGGHGGGDEAAEIAALTFKAAAHIAANADSFISTPYGQAQQWLRSQCESASRDILRKCGDGPATTATVARIVENGGRKHLVWVSIGDSRLYMVRDGWIRQLTRDEGYGNVIENSLGGFEDLLRIEQVGHERLYAGDRLLLVTDGITGDYGLDIMLPDKLLEYVNRHPHDPKAAAELLVHKSLKKDDGTAVVVDVD